MSNAEIAERLEAIGRELDEHPERWTQRYYARCADGTSAFWTDADAVCWCAVGYLFREHIYEDGLGPLVAALGKPDFEPIYKRHEVIATWNNAAERTAAEVAAAFHEAAEIARLRVDGEGE